MADKKISQLNTASTPLAGTEVLPIVQSGSTVKVSAADITAGRNISASGVTISGGTADGVVYLNGSKAATTGGSFVFNGTNLGIGTGSPDNLGRITTEGTGNSLNVTRTSGTGNRAGWISQNTAETIRLFSEVYGASAANTGFGVTLAGYSVIQALGTASNGLIIGTATSDPLIFGTADTNRGQFDTSGNFKVENGNVIVGTAAKGIDFSANTHAAGMTSELLNWYETGTWTPTLTCTDGNFTSVTYDPLRGGRYTRVGNMVHVQCYMRTDAVDNTVGRSGDVLIAGLPFAAVTATSGTLDGHSSLAVSVASAWTGEEPLAAFISGGDNNIQLLYRSAVDGGTSNIVAADVNTGANANIVLIAGTYICA